MLYSQSSTLIVTNGLFALLAIGAVVLRILIRKHKTLKLQADDYFVVGALFFSVALAITNIVGAARSGFGVPFEDMSTEMAVNFLKILFVLQFWYIIAVGLVKLSVLCLYGRLFSVRSYPKVIWIMLAISISWTVSFLFATFFQIWPLWCNWIDCPYTTNYEVMYMCSSVTDIALDIAILSLPISFVRKLQITHAQKVALTSVFGLGIFCIVSSIARLYYTVLLEQANVDQSYASNFTTAVVGMIMWSGIEACASVICACLPCFQPLLKAIPRVKSFIAGLHSKLSNHSSQNSQVETTKGSSQITNLAGSRSFTACKGQGIRSPTGMDLEAQGIKIERTFGTYEDDEGTHDT